MKRWLCQTELCLVNFYGLTTSLCDTALEYVVSHWHNVDGREEQLFRFIVSHIFLTLATVYGRARRIFSSFSRGGEIRGLGDRSPTAGCRAPLLTSCFENNA